MCRGRLAHRRGEHVDVLPRRLTQPEEEQGLRAADARACENAPRAARRAPRAKRAAPRAAPCCHLTRPISITQQLAPPQQKKRGEGRRLGETSSGAAKRMLGLQHFAGNPLCRLSDIPARFRAAARPDAEVSLVVVAGRDVVVRAPAGGGGGGGADGVAHPQSQQHHATELQALLLRQDDPELRLGDDELALAWVPGAPLVLLLLAAPAKREREREGEGVGVCVFAAVCYACACLAACSRPGPSCPSHTPTSHTPNTHP